MKPGISAAIAFGWLVFGLVALFNGHFVIAGCCGGAAIGNAEAFCLRKVLQLSRGQR